MTLETWIAFCIVELVLCLTPGPAVLFVVSTALTRGPRAAFAGAGGILIGNTLYFVLSATGIAAILLASSYLFTAMKWIGAAYLIWLGLSMLIARPRETASPAASESGPAAAGSGSGSAVLGSAVAGSTAAGSTAAGSTAAGSAAAGSAAAGSGSKSAAHAGSLWRGFAVQAANPKAIAFFVALLPQFIDPSAPVVGQILILGVSSAVIELGVLGMYIFVAAGTRAIAGARIAWLIRRAAGGLLVAAGARLALVRSP